MIHRTILDHTGNVLKEVVSETADESKIHYVIREDLEPLIKQAKFDRENVNMKSSMRPVAHIPAAVADQMFRDGSLNDPKALKKWLNDPSNKCFRVWEGRV
jgi:hypothetical protein